MNFLRKAGQSVMLISFSKSCGEQAVRHGRPRSARNEENAKLLLQKLPQPANDFVLPTVRWSDREHLFVRKENKVSGNFWSRSLARFMRAAQFASVRSCARHLLKQFRCKSLQIIWDTDDRWISVSRDISQTVLRVCGLSSWLRTKSLTVSTFSSVRAQIDGKSK